MTDTKERVICLIEEIRKERDELRVQASLAKLEARDEWHELEAKWNKLQAKAKAIGGATTESAEEIGAAASLLGQEIRDGFKRIGHQI